MRKLTVDDIVDMRAYERERADFRRHINEVSVIVPVKPRLRPIGKENVVPTVVVIINGRDSR